MIFNSPLGLLTAVENGSGLQAVYMAEHKRRPAGDTFGEAVEVSVSPVLAQTAAELGEYFAGVRQEFSVPLAPCGSPFQLRVWAALRTIPYGEVRSYGELAAALGDRSMAQAVGSANGRNPISIVVPCHRVLGSDGSLVGYAGGLERKQFLLELENPARSHTETLF
ncbi:methylated-DNA--[protein]-cysteine S-methyltransferase [Arthrobacter sp.]|uniref:methylated-DNA--[protein]-cysteine S-methyltransferase n=1 Tax=Arthrobacter sp. TaxID=1667 RepID=UPI0026E0B0B4|nr:methylated-DNA--[protein]-cysteine S-methyltransferase [Arthrobacter sp.]MDO5751552.1 methylated-DNA--[protein]-cysteine S-methyltransferase [Arthrobacter sp.]